MSISSKQSSPDDKNVVKGTSTAYNQSGNTQPDKGKSQREAEKQGDKVAEGTATYSQSINTQSGKNQPPPPKVNTKRKKVVKSAIPNQNQSQSDQQQSSTGTSSTQVDMQQYATKADVEKSRRKITKELGNKMDAKFKDNRTETDAKFKDTNDKMDAGFERLDKKNDKTRKEMSSQIKESTRFIIGSTIVFLTLLATVIGAVAAILTYLK